MFLNIFSVLWAFKRRHTLKRADRAAVTRSNGSVSIRRLPSAVLTAARIFAFRWHVPAVNMTLLEVLLTSLYLMAVLIWEFVNTQDLVIKQWANRAGHIAASQFPLIVGLSSKNNAIEVLTGVSHEKLNLMHRAVSRVMLLMVWIHWWARVYINAASTVSQTWRTLGVVAGVIQTVMTIISIAPIRKRFYEFFFITHVILVFVFLVTTYLHCASPGFGYYIWPCWLIWGIDRVCRWLRYIILSNFHAPNKTPAELELVNQDTIRITVRRWVPFGWRGGQHMFLAFPTLGPIESHPFTIATLPDADGKQKEMVWIVRARDGFTKRLRDHLVDKDGACRAPVFLDGPYGTPPDITPFDTCVFIAGGSGVTYTMPRMREVIDFAAAGKACATRIVWIWAVRHYSHISWLDTELRKAVSLVPTGVELSVLIYVTTGASSGGSSTQTLHNHAGHAAHDSDPEKEAECDEKSSVEVVDSPTTMIDPSLNIKDVTVVSGRPDLRKLLEDAVTTSTGPVSVDVSGPTPLVTSVRSILSSSFASPMAVLRGTPTVQLNVENFTM
ncbi:hypothetical protein NM688_g6196 [Phlebia brevispora]|uniref:Uncharacterized protein n=1 Tax=Phlebia brevispora TaxID=194682 RepID=A0ACC1SJ26_9APHY|nr:hypothetical protein NM688_g6196 [Phlebia brevispora]